MPGATETKVESWSKKFRIDVTKMAATIRRAIPTLLEVRVVYEKATKLVSVNTVVR